MSGRFTETDLGAELNMVALNVTSTLHLAKYVVKDMVARGQGRILVYGFDCRHDAYALSDGIWRDQGFCAFAVARSPRGAEGTAGADDTKLGAGKKDDAADVARDGFEALMAGKDHVVAGALKNKLQAAAGYVLPDPVVASQHAKQSEPESANK